jgi:ankyrin repeat protein
MATTNAQAHDLWKKAVDSLDPQVIAGLDPAKTGMRDIVTAVFRVAQTKRDESVKKRWRISRRGKQDIIVRDVMEKIVFWIERFKDVGDNAVQYDPGHAAIPWAAIRFVLQAAVNYTEVERDILEGIELVTRLLASFREVEKIYLGAGVLVELQDALVYAYATILETLAEAVKYLSQAKKIHGLKAPFQVAGGENIKKLLDRECQVLRFTRLVDGQRLLDVSTKVSRTAELSAITDKVVEGQKYQTILSWLSATKYLEHHDEQRKLRTPGTGTWLLQHAEYVSWQQESSSSILIVHGISGCGKTILSSLVIDECRSGQTPIHTPVPLAFFYCSASTSEPDRRNAASVLRSLVRQLTIAASRYPRIHSAVLAVYDGKVEAAKLHGFDLNPLHVYECEDLVVAALEDNPGTLIIDGLDEMDDPHDLLDSLKSICTKARNVVKIMITTRNSSQIKHKIPNARMVQITHAENSLDVERFITMELDQFALRRKISLDTRTKLVESLVSGSGEMFQWAKLQLSQLQASKQLAMEQDLADQLSKLAKSTLDELYSTIFEVLLDSGDVTREIVTHAFSWILYAQEPLTVEALLEATATGSGRHELTPKGILDICRGFIHVDSQSRIVRFDHQSVRSFLQSQLLFLPQQAQTLIALSCLRIFKEPPFDDPIDLNPTRRPYDYALLYFGHHVSSLDANLIHDSTMRSIENFLFAQSETGLYTTIWLEHARRAYDFLPRSHAQNSAMDFITSESSSPLFPICAFDMIYILRERTWPLAFDWDQRNKNGYTALYAASYFGHAEIVKFLLDHHVDPNIECGRLGSALQCAAYRGHDDVVRVLLGRGADPKLKRHFESAIDAACKGNNEEVVVTLLQSGFNINSQDEYDSVESEIAKAGLAQAMAELQRHPLSAKVTHGRNVQLAAQMIASGEVNGLNYLLRKSTTADIIPSGSLTISSLHGHEKMTTFLIDQGVSVNEAGELGTPLRCASIKGHNNICNILLSRGANVDENGPFGSALHAASMRGHLHTAKLLLNFGADVNVRGGHYGTPLQAAAYHGHTELVHLLLAAKASVHATGFSKDAIHAAVEGGRHGVVQLFLDAGFQPAAPIVYREPARMMRILPPNVLRDSSPRRWKLPPDSVPIVDPFDPSTGVPAYSASWFRKRDERGSYDVMKMSPMEVRTLNQKENNYVLEAASALGHRDAVAIILAEKSLRFEKDTPQFALATACRRGHLGVVEELTSEKYLIEFDLHEALHEAALGGNNDVVRKLLDRLIEQGNPPNLFESTLMAAMPDSPHVFAETLQRTKLVLSRPDTRILLSQCPPKAADTDADWAEMDNATPAEIPMFTPESVTKAFKRACDIGSSTVASRIYSLIDPTPISTPQLVRRTRAAAQDGHTELLHFLLSKCVKSDLEKHMHNMICLAAGDGMLEVMIVLLSWDARRQLQTLTTALAVGAQNGHEKVCAYLISQGADPAQSVRVPERSRLATKRRRSLAARVFSDRKISASGSDPESESDDGSDSASNFAPLEPKNVKHDGDAVQVCLSGYKRFRNRHRSYRRSSKFDCGSSRHVQDEAAQTRTLRVLLGSMFSFDERHWSHKVCTAAQFCPPAALEILLEKDVSGRSAMDNKSALQFAVIRKRWNHSIMQRLLQAGADQDLEESDLRTLLASALAQFDNSSGSAGRFHRESSLFPAVRSLDELFVTGCGAVVEYLLGRLPFEDASSSGYDVLLQTAAAAGRLGLVELLIARNIDVNATGSHYGTALQAACRFGHTSVAEVLLKAGAAPNLIQGEHCTALRAAVMCGSLPTVLLLLKFQADTTLTGPCWRAGDLQPTALYLAVRNKRADIVSVLLDAGASVEDAHNEEYLPKILVSACDWGECSVVRRLIDAGANLRGSYTGRRCNGITHTSVIHAAISCGHHDVVQLLIACGLDLTVALPAAVESGIPGDSDDSVESDASNESDESNDLLTFAISHSQNTAIINTLLQHLPLGRDTMLLRASKAAIEHNLVSTLAQLLDAVWDAKSVSILMDLVRTACRTPHESILELLFDHLFTFDNEPDLSSALALIDIREVRGELFDSWLCFVPYTAELFVEACIRGDLDLVQRGIDVGHKPDSTDKWARSPLHLAAAQGRTSVVQRLLETGVDVNRAHARYGTALVTALEGLSADKLKDRSTEESDRSYAAELAALESLKCDFIYADFTHMEWLCMSKRYVPFKRPRRYRASEKEYAKTIGLLLSNGARVENSPGRFGTALTLAAFAGLDLFDLLLTHGAKVHVTGGILGSPLSAAVDQGHMNIVDRLLGMVKSSGYCPDPGNADLHRACEIGDPTLVSKLLNLGHKPGTTDKNGKTALQISLDELGKNAFNFVFDKLKSSSKTPSDHERIVRLLIDADERPMLSTSEMDQMVAVTNLTDSALQSMLMDRIVASMKQARDSEKSFIRLIRSQNRNILQRILDKKAILSITTAMLASAYDVDTLAMLLEYDPSYVVTSATIDAVQTGRNRDDTKEMTEMLLLRSPSLQLTESQVCRALAAKFSYRRYSQHEKPRLLDLMFTRNPDFRVTQEMLETVRDPTDLAVLLAHVVPGKHVVTDHLLTALAHDHEEELLRMFLDFEPTAKVSSEIAQQFFGRCELDTVECLLDHDKSIFMLPENVSSVIDSVDNSYDRDHCRLVEILQKHPGQYEMTQYVKTMTVDSLFRQHSEKHLKDMYYKLASWTEAKEQSREVTEVP